ncbi:MAG: hypothetical protein K0S36_894 [Nitrosospira multiformis]|nr:hypothetical protein [Nitrosospira multiformis]
MKAARTTLIKRSIASITAGMATLAPVSGIEAALFTVSATIQEHIQPEPGCAHFPGGTITGSGISSFGAVSLAANDCITPAADFSYFSFQGKMTFTFFGGDQIFADYWGQFVPTSPSIFALKNSFFDITGGTGRFQNADGGKNPGRLYGTEVISGDFTRGWGLIQATGDITGLQKNKKGTESSLELLDLTDPADENIIVAINELPESDSLALLGIGLASLAFVRRKVSR